MREIKFRAKQINDNNWISGYGVIIGNGFCAIPYVVRGNTYDWKLTTITCDINTLGQYTGLKDKNGKEIYEGDVLRIKEYENDGYRTFGSDESFDCLTIDECKGKLLREGNELVCFTDGCMSVGDTMYISSLFGDMRYSFPIFEFEVIGNIHDNPDLIKEEYL